MLRHSPLFRGISPFKNIFRIFFLAGCLLLIDIPALSQDRQHDIVLQKFLVTRIRQLQAGKDATILPGLFYSYISNKEKFSDTKSDENIFYNGLVAYILKNISTSLSLHEQSSIDSILNAAKPAFSKFRNTLGRSTYNFWRTDTTFTFPYTWWIKIIRGNVTLPDDLDDTSLGLLALDAPDSIASSVHKLMTAYINDGIHTLRNPVMYMKDYKAYSVWFGKNFPVVMDISVLANVLSFTQTYDLPWSQADSASLQLILKVIQEKDYIHQPLAVSPYYGKPSIFLYNLARLMAIKKIPELEAVKTSLLEQAAIELSQSKNVIEQIILSTAILKWGYLPPEINLPAIENIQEEIEQNDFAFFIGNIPSYLSNGLRNILMSKNAGLFYHYCPAHNDALLLEYLVLKNKD